MGITRLGQNRMELVAGVAAKTFVLMKINGKGIVSANHISVYNSHAAQTLTFYVGIIRNGKLHRHHYKATLAAADVELVDFSLYLHAGDELFINALGSGAGTTFEVCFQLLDVE